MYYAYAGCVVWLCPYGSETNATTPRTFDSSYHAMEVVEMLHCLSPGTCSGDEAVLGSGVVVGLQLAVMVGLQPPAGPQDLANEDVVERTLHW